MLDALVVGADVDPVASQRTYRIYRSHRASILQLLLVAVFTYCPDVRTRGRGHARRLLLRLGIQGQNAGRRTAIAARRLAAALLNPPAMGATLPLFPVTYAVSHGAHAPIERPLERLPQIR